RNGPPLPVATAAIRYDWYTAGGARAVQDPDYSARKYRGAAQHPIELAQPGRSAESAAPLRRRVGRLTHIGRVPGPPGAAPAEDPLPRRRRHIDRLVSEDL